MNAPESPTSRTRIPASVLNDPDRLLTAAEARAMLGVGETLFDQWVANGLIPKPLRVGRATDIRERRRRWRRADIIKIIQDASQAVSDAGTEGNQ